MDMRRLPGRLGGRRFLLAHSVCSHSRRASCAGTAQAPETGRQSLIPARIRSMGACSLLDGRRSVTDDRPPNLNLAPMGGVRRAVLFSQRS